MLNNSSNSGNGKGGSIIILFNEPTLADALLPQALRLPKTFFSSAPRVKNKSVQAKKIMQKLSDSSLKMEYKSVQFQRIFDSIFYQNSSSEKL